MKILCNGFMHQQARAGAADFALIEPDCVDQSFNRTVDICVIKYDIG